MIALDEEELEIIRRKKLEELQRVQTERLAREEQEARIEAQRELILRQILTPEARERLGRIELAYPEVTENIQNQLIALVQTGRINKKIDDSTLQDILRRVLPRKREIKIERR